MMRASFFRRAPRLLLAVALIAQAVLFVHDAPPARATHGDNGHLSELTITGTVTRDGEPVTLLLLPNPLFDPHTGSYTLRVPSDLQKITFRSKWTEPTVSGWDLYDKESDPDAMFILKDFGPSGSGIAQTFDLDPIPLALQIRVFTTNALEEGMRYNFTLQRTSLSFGGATVADMTFTQDGEVPRRGLSQDQVLALALPKATGGFYNVTYTAAGLPEGLYMNYDRVIRGTTAARPRPRPTPRPPSPTPPPTASAAQLSSPSLCPSPRRSSSSRNSVRPSKTPSSSTPSARGNRSTKRCRWPQAAMAP